MADENQKRLHVAIIMDGNGRWAAQRGLPRTAGHRAGIAAVRRVVERAPDAGVGCLTMYAFSSDNWKRPTAEVEAIFRLLRIFLRVETARLRQNGVRLEVIGRRDRLPPAALRAIEKAERATSVGRRLLLRMAIDYSSREAIARAAAGAIASLGPDRAGSFDRLVPRLGRSLTAECGEVDLLIRTGGEKRLSDFLLWECAYAELVFTHRMWPDFDAADLDAALDEFRHRERRFGGVPEGGSRPVEKVRPAAARA
jgi:undecaprenyl diphosphate synthase